jgi:hypothetical protein
MDDRFTLIRRAYLEHRRVPHQPSVLGRCYRLAGRACLLGAAISGCMEIFNAFRGEHLPHFTLRSVLDLSPHGTTAGLAPMQSAIQLAVDSPLWVVLVVAAAIPYGLAVHRFLREKVGDETVA